MSAAVTILLVCVLVAILFAVIACDEVRRLGRLTNDQHDTLVAEVELRIRLEKRVIALEQRDRARAPRRRGQDLPTIPGTHLQIVDFAQTTCDGTSHCDARSHISGCCSGTTGGAS